MHFKNLAFKIVGCTCALFLMTASAGCGSCDDEAATPNNLSEADASGEDTGDGGAADAEPTNDATDTDPGDVPTDTDPGDADPGDADGGDDGGIVEDDECPAYQRVCDGECTPTNTDPDNCGACGETCASDEVCSGGQCLGSDQCMGQLSACDRSCVDTNTDSDHCGGCDIACDDGEGCAQGSCVPTLLDYDEPSVCADGGPPIDIGGAVDDRESCAGNLAENTFRWALCSCEDVNMNNDLLADAYDSTLGPYQPGGFGGGVGVNGAYNVGNRSTITGSLWASGQGGMDMLGDNEVSQRLYSGGPVNVGDLSVGDDAFVEGDLMISTFFDVGGTLHLRPNTDPGNNTTYGDLKYEDVSVPQACTECDPGDRVPIADIVADHELDNDNALIGLDADALSGVGSTRLDLPCGNYYLDSVQGNSITIVAHGNTAVYVGGDINAQDITISADSDGQLDLFVAGDVISSNQLDLGSPNHPALMRVYIGGDGGLSINNRLYAGANLYVVPGGINNNVETEVFGALYVQDFASNVHARFHYDRRVTSVGDDCPDPTDPDPDPDADAGYDAGDADVGTPDADQPDTGEPDGGDDFCGTQDDNCSTDSDCCSPLVCSEGQCTLLECLPLGADCTEDSQCCGDATCSFGSCVGG